MAYATLTELKAWLGTNVSATNPGPYEQLTDYVTGGTASDTKGQVAIDGGEGEVNAYVSMKYSVPVDTSLHTQAAHLLRRLTLSIAEYILWKSHPRREEIPERVQNSYDDAIDMLKNIASGELALPIISTEPEGATGVSSGTYARRMTEDEVNTL